MINPSRLFEANSDWNRQLILMPTSLLLRLPVIKYYLNDKITSRLFAPIEFWQISLVYMSRGDLIIFSKEKFLF